ANDRGPLHYQARGLIRGLPPDHKTLDIQHEDIAGFMPSMTMPFELRNEKEISGLQIGDAVSFRLNVTQNDSWIDQIQKIDPATLHLPTPAPTARSVKSDRLHEGDVMPPFHLVDQNNQPISLATFRGHPLVITFIFTRCPLPNFCPRMSRDFAELQKSIKASSTEPLASTRLLSISFDPAHDSPAVLQHYGQAEGADPSVWLLATGKPAEIQRLTKGFSVLVQLESGTISHSLATALIDKKGVIEKIWRGNAWTPAEVLQELEHDER
ncbi:MAG: SCO family protein, partial [Chthoniobacterales bacterium]